MTERETQKVIEALEHVRTLIGEEIERITARGEAEAFVSGQGEHGYDVPLDFLDPADLLEIQRQAS